ncbi:gp33 [Burkholderia lata]|uniref:Gp33 n=1 Tax=Burkholderia lata (strain ATCC 17760 / DSM 23089 / LMG 22485 / NCIMB 9086 / R18194 / 383) TaxID=482957 RepID=A0A6P2W289_BURL3|nr:gp33 [Burkholderia lata]
MWHLIGLADWRTMCVAGIWRTLQGENGVEHHTMSMITVSGEGHPIFSQMHKPNDEK